MKTLLLMMALARMAVAEPSLLIAATTPGQAPPDPQALARELGDVLAGDALAAAIDARLGPPPARLSPSTLSLLQARVKQAERNLFFNGSRVRESIADLEDVRVRLGEAQGSLAHDRDARALLQYVLVKLTRAYQIEHVPDAGRLADARAEELVRLFPDRPLDAEHYERELIELYDRVRRRLVADGRLVVTLPPGLQLYVEGMLVPPTVMLVPGTYRVFASDGKRDGRVHRVEIERAAKLTIDATLELALAVTPPPALIYASATERHTTEPLLVARLGHALGITRAHVVAVEGETAALASYQIGVGDRAILLQRPQTAERPRSTTVAAARAGLGRSQATGAPADRALHRLELAGWATLASGLPAAVVGAALWPRTPGPRAGIPLVAAGTTLALAGTDWLVAVATIRGRRSLARTLAIVAAAWTAAALASGLAQPRR